MASGFAVFLASVGAVVSFLMLWATGANDVGNAFGTGVGTGAFTYRTAVIIAAIFELAGASLIGANVVDFIQSKFISLEDFGGDEELFAAGMFAAAAGTFIWVLTATCFALPVSTTHAIVGAVIAFVIVQGKANNLSGTAIGGVAAGWFTSPILGGIISAVIYLLVKVFVMEKPAHVRRARHALPLLLAVTLVTDVVFILVSGPELLRPSHLSPRDAFLRVFFPAIVITAALAYAIGRYLLVPWVARNLHRYRIEFQELHTYEEKREGRAHTDETDDNGQCGAGEQQLQAKNQAHEGAEANRDEDEDDDVEDDGEHEWRFRAGITPDSSDTLNTSVSTDAMSNHPLLAELRTPTTAKLETAADTIARREQRGRTRTRDNGDYDENGYGASNEDRGEDGTGCASDKDQKLNGGRVQTQGGLTVETTRSMYEQRAASRRRRHRRSPHVLLRKLLEVSGEMEEEDDDSQHRGRSASHISRGSERSASVSSSSSNDDDDGSDSDNGRKRSSSSSSSSSSSPGSESRTRARSASFSGRKSGTCDGAASPPSPLSYSTSSQQRRSSDSRDNNNSSRGVPQSVHATAAEREPLMPVDATAEADTRGRTNTVAGGDDAGGGRDESACLRREGERHIHVSAGARSPPTPEDRARVERATHADHPRRATTVVERTERRIRGTVSTSKLRETSFSKPKIMHSVTPPQRRPVPATTTTATAVAKPNRAAVPSSVMQPTPHATGVATDMKEDDTTSPAVASVTTATTTPTTASDWPSRLLWKSVGSDRTITRTSDIASMRRRLLGPEAVGRADSRSQHAAIGFPARTVSLGGATADPTPLPIGIHRPPSAHAFVGAASVSVSGHAVSTSTSQRPFHLLNTSTASSAVAAGADKKRQRPTAVPPRITPTPTPTPPTTPTAVTLDNTSIGEVGSTRTTTTFGAHAATQPNADERGVGGGEVSAEDEEVRKLTAVLEARCEEHAQAQQQFRKKMHFIGGIDPNARVIDVAVHDASTTGERERGRRRSRGDRGRRWSPDAFDMRRSVSPVSIDMRTPSPDFHHHVRFYGAAEAYFAPLTLVSACTVSFAHGGNDVANAVGPYGVIADLVAPDSLDTSLPVMLNIVGGVAIVTGLLMYGYRVMETVGSNITKLTLSKAFAAQYGASVSILCATLIGLPISSTAVLIGCVAGVGLADGDPNAVDWKLLRNVVLTWIITLPCSGAISALVYVIVRSIR
ncbi:Pho4 family protein [Salpingoeca rosetta]|uniref:Pho4 family protein n=1 Tax=Salpingoeca rosetta (strain ATCC 50818 / BSB-021) TaxID=946362 RepID=F2U4D4_SALR5|nr:Pho4 family protein [Salpingoeca rosetta]EGD82500.1 Pho4 family protein [Salpingoeca rosetta]|eukprot:XP_004995736.1 Pho4 family protein [Salpingoeca rosetta]